VIDPEDGEVDDVTLPLLIALERLSPLERAAFLLHDVFGVGFDEIADTLDRDAAACRQLASRARSHVRAERPRFAMPRERGLEIAAAFFNASRHGDMVGLRSLLADDVAVHSDGGGKVHAGLRPIIGIDDAMKLHGSLARFFAKEMSRMLRWGMINGLPGFVTVEPGGVLQTTALAIEDRKIVGIYVMRNPDKLRHLGPLH
jgi:RNA polymerase sigma-70 factor (ECF subfamily)